MRILLIEDEAPLARMVQLSLQKANWQVEVEADGLRGFERTCEERFDLVLLDLMLPGLDGWSVCRRMRDRRDPTPILMLTARDDIEDRVKGLELGADDYLPKPFDLRELQARAAALIRRSAQQRRRVVRLADVEVDTSARLATRGGADLRLTPREFDLLELFLRHEGRVVTREQVLASWGEPDVSPNTVEVHVAALRKKLDAGSGIALIRTVHRRGYILESLPSAEDS